MRLGVLAISATLSVLAGCQGRARLEAAALEDAMENYRRANDAAKSDKLRAVHELPCVEAPVCAAKQSCCSALEATGRAVALKDEVALRVRDIQEHRLASDSPEAEALPAKLDEAGRLLQQGRASMGECERKLADLRIRYGR